MPPETSLVKFLATDTEFIINSSEGKLTPSKKWKAKSNTREILFGKIFEKPNLNNTAYNFVPKNAMKLRFNKSFDPTFSKVGQGLG